MRVAFVHPDYPGYEGTGATHTATLLARTLAARGHDVTVFCRRAPPDDGAVTAPLVGDAAAAPADRSGAAGATGDPSAPADADADVDAEAPAGPAGGAAASPLGPLVVDGAPDDATPLALRSLDVYGRGGHTATVLNRALREQLEAGAFEAVDVVHSYLPTSLPALGAIGRATPARTVVTLNAYGGVCPKNDLRYLDAEPCRERGLLRCGACALATSPGHDRFGAAYRAASRLGNLRMIRRGLARLDGVDAFHALSAHVRDAYAAFDFPVERTAVVPNPLDPRFLVAHESAFAPPYRLLYVGALERAKGVARLPRVLAGVRAAGIDATLTVVGDGGRRSAVETAAEREGVADAVAFRGRVPYADLPAVYAAHDLFVYPGRWAEPFGRVFLEALAAGTPVVGTDVGAVGPIVGDAGIVTAGDADALVDGIVTAVRDRGLAALAERCGAQLAPSRPAAVVGALEALYTEGAP